MADEVPKSTNEHNYQGDLMSSAKILAEAAQSQFGANKEGGENKEFDKAKVAGAAEDILEAAKSYGKLDETSGVGQYVDKAEGFLHKYHSEEHGSTPAPVEGKGGEEDKVKEKEKEKESDDGGASAVINMAKKGLGSFFS